MTFPHRASARFGVVAAVLLTVGALAAPASADTTADLEVKAADITIAAGSDSKVGIASLINHGPADAPAVRITFDARQLDKSKIQYQQRFCEQPTPDVFECRKEAGNTDSIANGADFDWRLPFGKLPGATGDAGTLTVTVAHGGTDPNPANNSATIRVTIAGNGLDLTVIAKDVRHKNRPDVDEDVTYSGPLVPGEQAPLRYDISNSGDAPTIGLKVTIALPAHLTPVKVRAGCVHTAARRSLVCTYPDLVLVPAVDDVGGDDLHSQISFYEEVVVSVRAPAPTTLHGSVTAESIDAGQATQQRARATRTVLPEGAQGGSARDVDPADNTDEYSAVIVARSGGSGGGDGDLPVTGVQVGLIGGVGLGVVALGGVLLLVSRRRRVVLATPADEDPRA